MRRLRWRLTRNTVASLLSGSRLRLSMIVFSAGDLALQEAARLALSLKRRPDAARLERIAERWRPLRGVAARMLWAYYRGVKARSGMALADGSG